MTSANRVHLQVVLATDSSLCASERAPMQRLVEGKVEPPKTERTGGEDRLLTQKQAAERLDVSRVTIWRMTVPRL